jgi:hypothetical protein
LFPGLQLLVEPVLGLSLLPAPTMVVPLSIPYAQSLIGAQVFGQLLFFDSGFAAGTTAGVQVTVLP